MLHIYNSLAIRVFNVAMRPSVNSILTASYPDLNICPAGAVPAVAF